MDAKRKFIIDAVAGGWKPKKLNHNVDWSNVGVAEEEYQIDIRHTLLDPLAWQAVGKTRGWETPYYERGSSDDCVFEMSPWLAKMHRFIDHRADGKTIDEALEAIG